MASSEEEMESIDENIHQQRRKRIRRRKFYDSDLSEATLGIHLERWIEQGLIDPRLDIDSEDLLSRPLISGSKASICLFCGRGMAKLERHLRAKHMREVLARPPRDPSTIDPQSSPEELRAFLHLSRLFSSPPHSLTIDLSKVRPPSTAHEHRNIRVICRELDRKGIEIVGLNEAYNYSQFDASNRRSDTAAPASPDSPDLFAASPMGGRFASPFPITPVRSRLPSHTPSTGRQAAPLIPQSSIEFVGLTNVDQFLSSYPFPTDLPPEFKGVGNLDLLFCIDDDDDDYVEITKRGNRKDWSQEAREMMGWNRILVLDQHPLLKGYCSFVDVKAEDGEWTRKTQQHLQYLLRVLVPVMRARGRLGESVAILDVACSGPAIRSIFLKMEKLPIGWSTAQNVVKALISLNRYVQMLANQFPDSWRSLRLSGHLSDVRAVLANALKRFKTLQEAANTHEKRTIAQSDHEQYPVLELILRSDELTNAMDCIERDMEKGVITKRRYDFVLNLTIAYLLTANAGRNELIWKCRNRSFYLLDPSTGHREIWAPFHQYPDIFIGQIDLPKAASRSKAETAKSGYFAYDDYGRKLLQRYEWIRDKRMKTLKVDDYDDASSPFFYTYEGIPIDSRLARTLTGRLTRFSAAIGLGIRLTANSIRHAAAKYFYEEYLVRTDVNGKSDELITLMDHSSHTHSTHYVDSKAALAVLGFVRLREITRSAYDDDDVMERIEELRSRIVVKVLEERGGVEGEEQHEEEDQRDDSSRHDGSDDDEEGQRRDENNDGDSNDEDWNDDWNEDWTGEGQDEEGIEGDGDEWMGSELWEGEEMEEDWEGMAGIVEEEANEEKEEPVKKKTRISRREERDDEQEEMEESGKERRRRSTRLKDDEQEEMEESGKERRRRSKRLTDRTAVEVEKDESFAESVRSGGSTQMRDDEEPHDCRLDGVDGRGVSCCRSRCICRRFHTPATVYEHDLSRIKSEIGVNRLKGEDERRLKKGFRLGGINSDPSLYRELRRRMDGPNIERFPWVNVRMTRGCGLGLYSTCRIPTKSIIVPYNSRIVSKKDYKEYEDQVRKERRENADALLNRMYDYAVEVKFGESSYFLEGHRYTNKGVTVLGRYANASSCKTHMNARLRREVVYPDSAHSAGSAHFLAVLVATREIEANEPILWCYDSFRPNQFPCPSCPLDPSDKSSDAHTAADIVDDVIRIPVIFGPDDLPERSKPVPDHSINRLAPYEDGYIRPLLPSDLLLSITHRLAHVGLNLETFGEFKVAGELRDILEESKRLYSTGYGNLTEGECRRSLRDIFDVALVDDSHRLLLLLIVNGDLFRSIVVSPPSSSSYPIGSIVIVRLDKKEQMAGPLSVLVPLENPTADDRRLLTIIKKSEEPVIVIDRDNVNEVKTFKKVTRPLYRFE